MFQILKKNLIYCFYCVWLDIRRTVGLCVYIYWFLLKKIDVKIKWHENATMNNLPPVPKLSSLLVSVMKSKIIENFTFLADLWNMCSTFTPL